MASLIRQPTIPGRTVLPTQYIWLTGFLCGRSVDVEFTARKSERPRC